MNIITHSGQFHADEIFACALLLELVEEMPILRTRDINDSMLENSLTYVIDVGGQYDAGSLNFDHHQDDALESSNVLVLNWLRDANYISDRLFERLLPMMREISNIDCQGYINTNGFQVNSLIKSYNSLPNGFDLAISVARGYVKSHILSEMLEKESRQIFDAGELITFDTVVCDKFPLFWKAYKQYVYLVAPTQDEQWAIHSIDPVKAPLTEMGNETFFHVGKFIAVYATKEEAVESAMRQPAIKI